MHIKRKFRVTQYPFIHEEGQVINTCRNPDNQEFFDVLHTMVFNLTILLVPSTAASCRAFWCCSNSFFLSSHWRGTYFWCLRPWLRSSRNFADSTWPNKHFFDQDLWLKNRPAYWPKQTLNWTSSKEQWLFSSKASFGFNPFRGILVDNDLWQCAALSNLDLTEF